MVFTRKHDALSACAKSRLRSSDDIFRRGMFFPFGGGYVNVYSWIDLDASPVPVMARLVSAVTYWVDRPSVKIFFSGCCW